MELLLLTDIPGIGKKDDLVVVGDGYALNHLLPNRAALVATPNVRRRYAEQIKKRAMQREQEKQVQNSLLEAVKDMKVTFSKKVTKTGKLYAAVTEREIAEALQAQHGITADTQAIQVAEPIKSAGEHTATLASNNESATFTVVVTEEK